MDVYQQYIAKSRYSRYLDDKKRRESYSETVDRYFNHIEKHLKENNNYILSDDMKFTLSEYVKNLDVMPSMRAMMTAGKALERDNTCSYNCCFVPVDDPKAFDEALHILTCGTGVGFSVEEKFVSKLPDVPDNIFDSDTTIVVKDSKEGWAKALRQLIALLYSGEAPRYDVSRVRKKGARLKTFGGRASGPEPLIDLFKFVTSTFKSAKGRKLKSIECHDIMCKIAEITVVGGVRRCLPEGTNVHTPDGYVKIENIKQGDFVITPYGNKRVIAVADQGIQNTVFINHGYGQFECTPNHRMAVFKNESEWEFKPASEIKEGDRLVFSNSEVLFGKKTELPKSDFIKSKSDHTSVDLVIPEIDSEIAWFLGYFAGDGHVGIYKRKEKKGYKGHVTIAIENGKDAIKNKLIKCFGRFGFSNIADAETKGNYSVLKLSSIQFADWIVKNLKQANKTIRVPDYISQADPSIRWAYLSGVFDSDGSCSKPGKQPTLNCTVYKDFADDIVSLYKSLGVLAYYKIKHRENGWQTIYHIKTKGIHNYNKIEHGFSENSLLYTYKPKRDVDGFSFEKESFLENKKYNGLINHCKSVTARLVEEVNGCSLDFYPVKVTGVEQSDRYVNTWDIEVEDVHQFIAEGFVTHNSALISLSDLEDDGMREAKSGSWWNQHGQRALANNSAVYESKPTMSQFMKEWTSLYLSFSGERGLFSREASKNIAKQSGRRNTDFEFGTNPCCFTGEMNLLTTEGYIPFRALSFKDSFDIVNHNGEVTKGKVWSSGIKPVYKISFEEYKKDVICTNDHVFMLEDGSECKAIDLKGKKIKGYSSKSYKVSSVDYHGEEEVFDFTEPETHWGVVEDLIAHNSEIILRPYQFCNLTSIVVKPGDDLESLKKKAEIATILGTFQSTMTHFPYLRKIWQKNTEEERLLGVSLTGLCDHLILSDPSEESARWLNEMREVVVETNKKLAEHIGIPQSTATTCVKPEGTASQLNDTASGMHPRYAEYYVRRVRNDKKDPLTQFLIDQGIPYEDDVMNPSTVVFSFPRKSPSWSKMRDDKTAIEQLEYWKHLQENWCEHKPSVTVYVKDDEWMKVGAWVYENFDSISGVSFLPYDGGTYRQAPYEEITKEQYDELVKKIPESIDWDSLIEIDDNVEGVQTLSCTAGVCEI